MRFAMKVDAWLRPAAVLGFACLLGAGMYVLWQQFWLLGLLLLGGFVAGLVVMRMLVWPGYYVICEDGLIIRTGRQRHVIKWQDLRTIEPTRHAIPTATAWSFDRLRIQYVSGQTTTAVHVSPVDQPGFIDAIAQFSPTHEVEGRSLASSKELPAVNVDLLTHDD